MRLFLFALYTECHFLLKFIEITIYHAEVAQLVERRPSKLNVVSLRVTRSLVFRSKLKPHFLKLFLFALYTECHFLLKFIEITFYHAEVAQLVERQPSKLNVVSLRVTRTLVFRSKLKPHFLEAFFICIIY
ncbi:Hypothetical protein KQS_11695 [Flavobacterium indicum GPTSA100-9 = DSM 17447]|uniref:Uncharacterized protein n=1 Tax=Flavobacterium indicum (strain DSM 17447 / CIP 109464 / GPTSA100-9) TaxID=1094466 RepID=H8XR17_FLAIG|nr:Hypothetical protein KQS_11695 [Flavobacterium indicum GPTSA100-9 = DSM 17447]